MLQISGIKNKGVANQATPCFLYRIVALGCVPAEDGGLSQKWIYIIVGSSYTPNTSFIT